MLIPALFTRMSHGPSAASAAAAKARVAAGAATSASIWKPRLPRAVTAWTSVVACAASFRWQIATSAPASAKASAMARPIPRLPPVM